MRGLTLALLGATIVIEAHLPLQGDTLRTVAEQLRQAAVTAGCTIPKSDVALRPQEARVSVLATVEDGTASVLVMCELPDEPPLPPLPDELPPPPGS